MAVETKYGKIAGLKKEGYTLYKGIPYAKPPVGELRFRAPVEPDCWDGIYQADTFPPKCPQEPSGFALYTKEFYSDKNYLREESEDCLYLNIWVPEQAENLPVAFWIHGGGFGGGYGSEIEFDGAEYCKKGVILVTIQYRVNIFGFLTHPWLSAENDLGISGNYGILDQIMALKWVYQNIHAFGGDAENITAFGQSAGSSSVQTLISTDLTEIWIKKAIMQSASGYQPSVVDVISKEKALKVGEAFAAITSVHSAQELRALTVAEITDGRRKLEQEMQKQENGLFLLPHVDGYLLKDNFDQLTRRGAIKNIPYLLGSTENDLFVSPEDVAAGKMSDLYHGCINFSLQMESLNRPPAYVYYFKHHLPGDEWGAFHSAELWYMFGTLERCWRPMTKEDYSLSRQMVEAWTNFMKNGNPNPPKSHTWEACTKQNPFVKIF